MENTVKQALPLELSDYLSILRRRKVQIIVPLTLVLLASLLLAFLLPPVYQSEATILVKRQEIPSDLVETTVTGYVQEQIETLTKSIMTPDKLWEIAEKLDLYPEIRIPENRTEVVNRMLDSIKVDMVDVQTTNPEKAKQTIVTLAFTVSFEANTPEVAQKVANELANLYIEEFHQSRKEQAAEVSKFLSEQANKLKQQVTELESKLATFKQENRVVLPELSNINLTLLEQTNTKLEQSEERILSLEQQEKTLRAQLRVTEPYAAVYSEDHRLLTPDEQLRQLRAEYLSKSATYSTNHPDMVRIRREIRMLERQLGRSGGVNEMQDQLDVLRSKLAEARRSYSEEHPDVKQLKSSIAALESEIRNASSVVPSAQSKTPDNPDYVSLQSELNTVIANLRAEKEKRNQLEKKLEDYESRLFQTPIAERDYLNLSRDYESALKQYREIKEKQLDAEIAERLEKEQKGERFSIIQEANLPNEPIKPNRLGIALLGFTFAFSCGIGSAAVAEYLDRSVRGFRGVTLIQQAPPLAGIPYIETRKDRLQRRKRRLGFAFIVIATLTLSLIMTHYYLKPIDQIWGEITQKVDTNAAVQTPKLAKTSTP